MYDFNYVVYIYFFIIGQYIENYRYMYNRIEVGSNAETIIFWTQEQFCIPLEFIVKKWFHSPYSNKIN